MKSIDLSFNTQSKDYTISIESGLLKSPQAILSQFNGNSIFIISDSNVAPLYLDQLQKTLFATNTVKAEQIYSYVITAGESSKSLQNYQLVIEEMINCGLKRNDLVIALGGGIVGDLSGFVAATYFRGMDFVQIPTTLLSQVDSSIGGKTAINSPQGKNLIGAFHQPTSVIIDIDTLNTLPDREFYAGLAEIIKAAILHDASFFQWISERVSAILQKDTQTLAQMIEHSCNIKAHIVAQDEKEQGIRATLNLGHTFGHAIEKLLGYGILLHGEAIAIGMVWASQFACEQGMLSKKSALAIEELIKSCKLPSKLSVDILNNCSNDGASLANELVSLMQGDKKNTSDKITLILPIALGEVIITDAYSTNDIKAFLSNSIQGSTS